MRDRSISTTKWDFSTSSFPVPSRQTLVGLCCERTCPERQIWWSITSSLPVALFRTKHSCHDLDSFYPRVNKSILGSWNHRTHADTVSTSIIRSCRPLHAYSLALSYEIPSSKKVFMRDPWWRVISNVNHLNVPYWSRTSKALAISIDTTLHARKVSFEPSLSVRTGLEKDLSPQLRSRVLPMAESPWWSVWTIGS